MFKQIDGATRLIQNYSGQQPLSLYLKDYFRSEKKHGSTDRKRITSACYAFFRIGKALPRQSIKDKVLAALFIVEPLIWHPCFSASWDTTLSFQQRVAFICQTYNSMTKSILNDNIVEQLEENCNPDAYSLSFLIHPLVFIRIPYKKINEVQKKLQQQGIIYSIIHDTCIAVEQGIALDSYVVMNHDIFIQDIHAQKVRTILDHIKLPNTPKIWDCCAGSGGKSLLFYDAIPKMNLTVSDMRPAILYNLKKRFSTAGLKKYTVQEIDLTKQSLEPTANNLFDLIIADVPCSGSGTWARTPEAAYYFDTHVLEQFEERQKKIIESVLPNLKSKGFLAYITCSVFKKENSLMVAHFKKTYNLTVVYEESFYGYALRSDSMFVAVLQKNE
ncbi:MAG: hypothetical protein QM528_03570 [Phycisphaerales bacterium]|nr:hypothetical protein [Phycisphaerales bacterium]